MVRQPSFGVGSFWGRKSRGVSSVIVGDSRIAWLITSSGSSASVAGGRRSHRFGTSPGYGCAHGLGRARPQSPPRPDEPPSLPPLKRSLPSHR